MSAKMTQDRNSINAEFGKWLSSPPPGEEVVITGISGRLPKCRNVEELSNNLLNKHDMVDYNSERWTVEHPEIPKRSGIIPDVHKMDAGYFKLHRREVEQVDMCTRKFYEVTTEAIIDAGIHPSDLENTRTGVFVGFSMSDTAPTIMIKTTEPNSFVMTGCMRSMIAQRINYFLKVNGPSLCIDTACSSSLYAIEHAFRAIRTGRCDNAIVGGAQLTLHPAMTLQFSRIGVLSKEGCSKVFDQDANGYVRSETIASVFLQKAKNSKRIYAKVIHAKCNTDGFKDTGLLFPSSMMQATLLKEVYDECGVKPDDLSYFELHGTATKVGDVQEVQGIDEIFGKNRTKPLWIGSVKSNIGHAEPASGMGSLFKVLSAMQTGYIAPNLHCKKIKKEMDAIIEGRLLPVTEKTKLDDDAIIGISNFGFGGCNSHVVLQSFCKKKSVQQDNAPQLVCVSGRTEESVRVFLEGIIRRKDDREWMGLIRNIFRKEFDSHLYRGYVVLRENKKALTSVQLHDRKRRPIYVHLGTFAESYESVAKFLFDIPIFKTKLNEFQKILNEKIIDLNQNMIKNGNVIGAVGVQLCIVEILEVLDLRPTVIWENSLKKKIDENPILKSFLQDTPNSLNNVNASNSKIIKLCDSNEALRKNPDYVLEIIGSLFEEGYVPQIQKLYGITEFPLDCKAPHISSLIKWNYDVKIPMKIFHSLEAIVKETFEINLADEEHKYITGHVIDGRNLYPATGYLYMVWQVLAEKNALRVDKFPVVFRNCRFIRATTMTNDKYVFDVIIQEGTGKFEIVNNNTVCVTGQAYHFEDIEEHQAKFLEPKFDEGDPKLILGTYDIYKELNLRGYNYSGLFRGLTKCNMDATAGSIQWNNNWVTFMDNMLQLKILEMDTRLLYVPTGIDKMVIDPLSHLEASRPKNQEVDLPIIAKHNLIKSGGIEIYGLQATAISKKQPLEPVLEKYEFVPNVTSLDLEQSIRVNTQIILEDSLEDDVKAVEIVDEFSNLENPLFMPLMFSALENVPVVRPDLTISSQTPIEEIPGVKIEPVLLNSTSNLLLVVATEIFQRNDLLNQILKSLAKNGFAISREKRNFVAQDNKNLTILTEHTTETEKLILFKKSKNQENAYVEVSSTNFKWIPHLQNVAKNASNVIVHSQNQNNEGILGFINCIRREPDGKKIKSFFIMDEAPKFDPSDPFYKNQIEKNQAINVYKNSKWGTFRHLLLDELRSGLKEHSRAKILSRGDLSSFKWVEGPLKYDHVDEKIHTYYCAINFKDVMTGSARITVNVGRKNQECVEGFEFSGRDSKGNRVMGMVPCGAFSNIVSADPDFCWPVPPSWSLEDGATVPVVYATVIYALLIRTTLKPGTSILIHSGTGGIGIAAINVALYFKCEIFVTVGTEEKRSFLKSHFPQIPDSHIGNSRDTSFEEMIKRETKGRGVDIVLNSLAEEKLHASIRCQARGGRFMEIGKFDLMNNADLSLLLLEKEASHHGIMLDTIMQSEGDVKSAINKLLLQGLKDGYVKPLPRQIYNHEEIGSAFRYMTTGKHIGKILIKIRDEEKEDRIVPPRNPMNALPEFFCDPQRSYVILGGLGGFGLELADWLVLRGAKKLLLTSRVGVQTGYQSQRIQIWTSYGAQVKVSTTSTSTKKGCEDLIEEAKQLGPLDAIFNLAVILEDALFEDQTEDRFNTSMTPKARTTRFLDEITRKLCPDLRHFVVFSSVSCGRGNAGQTNYGMANSVMERICERRKEDGYPALAIQWGAVGDVGLVAKMQNDNKELVIGGTLQQKISSCLKVMDRFLNQDNPVVASMVVAEKRVKTTGGTPLEAIAKIIGIKNLKSVSYHSTLTELGMDSIMGTEIIQVLEKDFGIYTTAKEIRTLTFSKLAELESATGDQTQNQNKISEGSNILLQHLPSCEKAEQPFVELESSGEKNNQTIFIFPGIEGVLLSLEPVAKNTKAKVLGVQYNYDNLINDIETIAKTILPHVEKQLSKDSPFFFIGYSFGVMVALEVASMLEEKNYVGKIAAIDGSPTYSSKILKQFTNGGTEAEFETTLLYNILGLFAPIELLEKKKDQLLKCENFDQRAELALTVMPIELIHKHKIEKLSSVILFNRFVSLRNYSFTKKKLKSLIRLYKASFSIVHDIEDDYGLSNVCTRNVESVTVEGNHETMLLQNELVEDINNFLSLKI